MNFTFKINQHHLAEHYNTVWSETGKWSVLSQVVNVLAWVCISLIYLHFFGPINKSHIALFFTVLIASGFSEWLRTNRLRKRIVNDVNNPALGTQNLVFDDEGITYSNELSNGKIVWRGIQRIGETESLFQCFVGSYEAILIPKHSVDNKEQFRQLIEEYKKNA